ncbi:hypothetical protein [Hahella sp. NBU794]|uniref:hypothetical protein n=1 Tax=Hahella sp. NBU794 TaxID=3422590 RepID=UPI003D6EE198
MDIWNWVHERVSALRESGEHRLADFVYDISRYSVNDEHHKVDALYPEALSLARKNGDKWLEIYFRHWHLQSQVLTRRKGQAMLGEAVDLLEFAHREETRDCPQSICVVQDLACCYAITDGPGYVEERLAVAQETLSRIDASWPCFTCIGGEYNSALIDAGRFEDALASIRDQKKALTASHRSPDDTNMLFCQLDALIGLHRYEEAEKLARKARNDGGGEHFERRRKNYLAWCLALLERAEEAEEALLSYDETMLSPAFFEPWIKTKEVLASKQASANSEELDLQINAMLTELFNSKAWRDTVNLGLVQAQLALARGAVSIARLCAQRVAEAVQQLHRDCGATEELAALNEAVTKAEVQRTPWEFSEIEQFLEQQAETREAALEMTTDALRKWPDDERVLLEYTQLLDASGWSDAALAVLREKSGFQTPRLLMTYGSILIEQDHTDEFLREFGAEIDPALDDDLFCRLCWLKMRFYSNSYPQQAYEHVCKLIDRSPEAGFAIAAAARLAMKLGSYQESVNWWTRLIALDPEEISLHWDRMVPATIAGDWVCVRESMQVLGMDVPEGEGPIDEDSIYVRVRFTDADGETRDYLAVRNGPVTARVIGLARLGEPQRFGCEVVFDAAPLNKLDQEDEEGVMRDSEGYYTLLFSVVHILKAPEYDYFAIDGAHPGDENLARLQDGLAELQVHFDRRSNEDYVLYLEDDAELPGVYIYIAVPVSSDLDAVNTLLSGFSAELEHPLIWPDLLEKLGDEAALEAQMEIQEKYGL